MEMATIKLILMLVSFFITNAIALGTIIWKQSSTNATLKAAVAENKKDIMELQITIKTLPTSKELSSVVKTAMLEAMSELNHEIDDKYVRKDYCQQCQDKG